MNLHGIVAGAIGAVNPLILAELQAATGYTTAADGTQVPTYGAPEIVQIQVQALTGREIQHLDALNIQGVLRACYLPGNWNGIVRAGRQGGDLLTFNQQNWLVVQVLESWPDWTKVAIALQTS